VDDDELTERLDVTAGNPYYAMQDALALPDRGHDDAPALDHHRHLGAVPERRPDVLLPQEPFLVTETNAMSIGGSWDNRPAYDGQWRQAAWALVARGAR
jgi:beta-galactosidase